MLGNYFSGKREPIEANICIHNGGIVIKQFMQFTLALALLCIGIPAHSVHAQDDTEPGEPLVYYDLDLKYPGITLLDVPPNSFDVPSISATLYVDTLYLYEYHFMLWGRVVYGNRARPIQLTATFCDSAANTDEPDKTASAVDATGNFFVAHVAIRRNPPDYVLLTGDQPDMRDRKSLLFIYLQRPDGPIPWQVENREVTFFEVPTSGTPLEEFTAPLLQRMDLPAGPFINDHWYILLLKGESSFSVDSYQSSEFAGCLWGYKIVSDPTIVELDLEYNRNTPDVRGYRLLMALSTGRAGTFSCPCKNGASGAVSTNPHCSRLDSWSGRLASNQRYFVPNPSSSTVPA